MRITFEVNGVDRDVDAEAYDTLLDVLRENLGLTGTKEGCGEGECGACTVLVNGLPIDSCLRLAASVEGCTVRTVEGLADNAALSPLQEAFIANASLQCGFCTPGLLMTLTALLEHEVELDDAAVRAAIAGNLCRCTGYSQVVEAVLSVGQKEKSS